MRADVYRDAVGEWRFRFVADNNEPMAPSEGYRRRIDCEAAILKIATELKEIVLVKGRRREVIWRQGQA